MNRRSGSGSAPGQTSFWVSSVSGRVSFMKPPIPNAIASRTCSTQRAMRSPLRGRSVGFESEMPSTTFCLTSILRRAGAAQETGGVSDSLPPARRSGSVRRF